MSVRLLLSLCLITALAAPAEAQTRRGKTQRKGVVSKLAAAAKDSKETTSAKSAETAKASTKSIDDDATTTGAEVTDASTTVSAEIEKADVKDADTKGDKVLMVRLTGEMRERGDNMVLFGQQTKSLKGYLDLLRKAREDKAIKTVVICISSAQLGVAMAQELRLALAEIRDKGKRVVAVVEDDSQPSYMVALAANEVVLPPSGDLMLYGVKADNYFLKNLLQKIGVSVQVVHVGQYKSYGEMFTNEDFTTPARSNMTEVVDDLYDQLVNVIATDRKMSREQAEAAVNKGPVSAEAAKAANLIDRVAYAEEVLADLSKDGSKVVEMSDYSRDTSPKADDVSLFSLFSMMNKTRQASTAGSTSTSKLPQVAVLYAVGPIVLGSDEGVGFGSEEQIASEDIIKTLEEIQEDDKVKALILRINSPGGSAFASDLIWKKIEEVKKVKPVIATMSDVAASGGYYIAMGASKIIAEPGTLTGSIGVVGGKPNLKGLYEKVGVNKTSISKGDFAHMFSETSDFSTAERQLIESMMKETYDEFIGKAAIGRKMPVEQLNELAQGRVWTGARAQKVGLVDELGGMGTAIKEAKALIGVKNDDKVALVAYPKDVTLMDLLSKAFNGNVTARASTSIHPLLSTLGLLPRDLQRALTTAVSFSKLFQREKVLTIMPFIPHIQ